MMEYFAIDLSRFVPFLVGPANYRLARMNSSFDLLEVFANQCSMYVPNGWLRIYLTNCHILTSVYQQIDDDTDG